MRSSWSEAVSSQSCFCWLYRVSLSLAANRSDFGIDHLVMSMCRLVSCVVGRGCLLWPVHSLGKTLLAFALLHSVLQGQICLLTTGISWLPIFAFQSPLMKKTSFFGGGLVLEGLVRLHRTVQLQLLHHCLLGQITVMLKQTDHSVVFETAPKLFTVGPFVDYEGYSISSWWFLHTVVDRMIIWI